MVDNGLTDSPHIDEGTLHAWLDGGLSADENAAVERHLAVCGACSAAAAEARGMIAASTRILSALDTVPADVIPRTIPERGAALHRRPAQNLRRYGPIAAVVAFAAISALVLRRDSGTVTDRVSTSTAAVPRHSVAVQDTVPKTERSVANASGVAAGSVHAHAAQAAQPGGAARQSESRATDMEPSPSARIAAAPAAAPAAAQTSAQDAAQDAAKNATQADNAAAAIARVDSAAITGRVTAAETGLPLAGASVVVAGTRSSATTDSLGSFSIPRIPSGAHTVIARRVGFAAQRAIVSVQPNQPAAVSLALPAAANSLSSVVATGLVLAPTSVAPDSAPAIAGARKVSSESPDGAAGRVRRTVYAIDSGAQVTLTEYLPARPGSAFAERKATAGSTIYLRGRETTAQPPHSISWSAADGTLMVLSGSLPEAELQRLKGRIVP